MSNAAIDWAIDQRLPSSQKLVLIILANRANPANECFPSVASLSHDTGLDRKIVIKSLDHLLERGLIEDSGVRRGTTKQIKVYRLKRPLRNSSTSGTVPNPEQFHISLETVPHLEHGTQRNPLLTPEAQESKKSKAMNTPSLNLTENTNPVNRGSADAPGRQPRSKDEARQAANQIGLSDAAFEQWWNECSVSGWRRTDGSLFDNWGKEMCNWKTYKYTAKGNGAPPGPAANGRPATITELQRVIDVKKARAGKLKSSNCNESPTGNEWKTKTAQAEYRKIWSEIHELENRIENSI